VYSSLCLCASSSYVCSWSFGLQSHKCVKNKNWVAPPSCHTSGFFTSEINISRFKKEAVHEWLLLRLPTDIKIVFILKGDDTTWYRTQAVSSRLCFNVVNFLFFIFCWPCISIHLCNKNQLDALFIFSLFHQSTSSCFGHIRSPSSGGILHIYNSWYELS
jgi:cellulose synthase/poly-beta-1,6-N-acetylglucosamine synthase-like glycosyltransferase